MSCAIWKRLKPVKNVKSNYSSKVNLKHKKFKNVMLSVRRWLRKRRNAGQPNWLKRRGRRSSLSWKRRLIWRRRREPSKNWRSRGKSCCSRGKEKPNRRHTRCSYAVKKRRAAKKKKDSTKQSCVKCSKSRKRNNASEWSNTGRWSWQGKMKN